MATFQAQIATATVYDHADLAGAGSMDFLSDPDTLSKLAAPVSVDAEPGTMKIICDGIAI